MVFSKGAKWQQIYFLQFLFFWVRVIINPVPKFIESLPDIISCSSVDVLIF